MIAPSEMNGWWVRNRVKDRWIALFADLAPELDEAAYQPGQHVPCPVHGGTDGFRFFEDAPETGGGICNTCGAYPDGLQLLCWVKGWSMEHCIEQVNRWLAAHYSPDDVELAVRFGPQPAGYDPGVPVDEYERLYATWTGAVQDPGRIEAYLGSRGLNPSYIDPDVIRLNPQLPYYENGHLVGLFPAMVANIQRESPATAYGLHITYLDPLGDGKAQVAHPKKMKRLGQKGCLSGGVIKLGKPRGTLAITEGIENAFTVYEATGKVCWAALSAGNLAKIGIPVGISRVEIWGDNDSNGCGQRFAEQAAAKFHKQGLKVKVLMPPQPGADWNDIYQGQGKEALLTAQKRTRYWKPKPPEPEPMPEAVSKPAAWSTVIPVCGSSVLPPFPTEALPPAIRDYVMEVAATLKVPEDLAAIAALGALATAGARSFSVRVGTTHWEPLCLFLVCLAPSGTRKSATFERMLSPLIQAEDRLRSAASGSIAAAKEQHLIQEKRLVLLRRRAAAAPDATQREELTAEASRIAQELGEVPASPTLIADDCTPEKLAMLEAENHGSLGFLSPEAGIFGMMGGRYSERSGPNLDVYLKGHAGDSLRVDRAGRPSLVIKAPALTIALGAQPEVMQSVARSDVFHYRGLIARFLCSKPKSNLGKRTYEDRPIDPHSQECYSKTLWDLLAVPLVEGAFGFSRNQLLITGTTLDTWTSEHDRVEASLGEGGRFADYPDWASKLPGAAARLAALFHLVEHGFDGRDHQVLPFAMNDAWEVARYFEEHALAVFEFIGEPPSVRIAHKILAWIRREHLEVFSVAQCYQAHRRTRLVTSPSDLGPALGLLQEHGYLTLVPRPTDRRPGRPSSDSYFVNPGTLVL